MHYVVYHKDTTRYLRNHPKVKTNKTSFATEAAAKAALTREANNGAIQRADFLISDSATFHNSIEKKVVVDRLGNGEKPYLPFEQSINTPLACDPRSETYWSM